MSWFEKLTHPSSVPKKWKASQSRREMLKCLICPKTDNFLPFNFFLDFLTLIFSNFRKSWMPFECTEEVKSLPEWKRKACWRQISTHYRPSFDLEIDLLTFQQRAKWLVLVAFNQWHCVLPWNIHTLLTDCSLRFNILSCCFFYVQKFTQLSITLTKVFNIKWANTCFLHCSIMNFMLNKILCICLEANHF